MLRSISSEVLTSCQRNEISVLEMLHHPNIVTYHGSFVEDGVLNIIMDFADGAFVCIYDSNLHCAATLGGDLHRRIRKAKEKPFPEQQIFDWFIQLCLALKHVHDKNILHRDLKTQNIFLTKRNLIKLGDFGIAKILTSESDLSRTVCRPVQ